MRDEDTDLVHLSTIETRGGELATALSGSSNRASMVSELVSIICLPVAANRGLGRRSCYLKSCVGGGISSARTLHGRWCLQIICSERGRPGWSRTAAGRVGHVPVTRSGHSSLIWLGGQQPAASRLARAAESG